MAGETVVKIESPLPVDFTANAGWYVDFPVLGERINVEMSLVRNILSVTTNTPKIAACVPIGESHRYFLDYKTGVAIASDGVAGINAGNNFSNTGKPFIDAKGTLHFMKKCDGINCEVVESPPNKVPGLGTRRTSWRELVSE
jgi:type IV pilus assembly protein PilY1